MNEVNLAKIRTGMTDFSFRPANRYTAEISNLAHRHNIGEPSEYRTIYARHGSIRLAY